MKAELGWCHFGKGTSLPATHPEYQINPYQKATQVLHCSGAVPSVKKKNWVSNWHQHYRTPWSAWPGKLFSVLASGPARNPYNPLDPTRLMLRKTPTQRKVIFRSSHAVQNRPDDFQFWWRNSLRTKKHRLGVLGTVPHETSELHYFALGLSQKYYGIIARLKGNFCWACKFETSLSKMPTLSEVFTTEVFCLKNSTCWLLERIRQVLVSGMKQTVQFFGGTYCRIIGVFKACTACHKHVF